MALGKIAGASSYRFHRNRLDKKSRKQSMIGLNRAACAVAESLESRVLLSAVSLVDNINKVTDSSNPSNFVVAGNELFFTADDGIHGQELWKSDGTSNGTVMVTDLVPGSTGSGAQPFAAMGNDVFFTTTSGGLYISDGTAGGTVQLSTVTPNVSNWTVYNGRLYFQGNDTDHGSELWTSDGTAAGTSLLADVASGTDSSSPSDLVALNGAVYFAANTSTSGNELWKTDGTAAGTTLVADINPGTGSSNPTALATMNNKLYFIASSSGSTSNLYVSDGTAAGTSEVSAVPAVGLASNSTLSVVGSTLYFLGTDATHGQELWKSDGTAAGTIFFYDLTPGTASTTNISSMYSANGLQFFWTYSTTSRQSQFWRTDGTSSGTSSILALGNSQFSDALAVGNYLYFRNSGSVFNLYRTDGSVKGTVSMGEYENGFSSLTNAMASLNGTVLFDGGIGVGQATPDIELLGVVPGLAQAVMIKEINTQMPYGSNLQYGFIRVGDQAYFNANDGSSIYQPQLWVTDGTEGGTHVVRRELNFGYLVGTPLGNSLLFVDTSGTYNGTWQLLKTDGTPQGTVVVQDLSALHLENVQSLATVGNLVYFAGDVQGVGGELWATDGTSAGTHLVFQGGAGSLTPVGNEMYFEGYDGVHGPQLWKTDGTPQGTVMVSRFANSHNLFEMTDVAGTLYFGFFASSSAPSTLWKSDGTTAGTVQITDPSDQLAGSFDNLTAVGDELYFTADTAANGVELWRTDGTSAGTEMVDDLTPGPGSSFFEQLEGAGSFLYFSALDSSGLGQLFRTDGTAAGTVQLTQGLTNSNGPGYHGVESLTGVGNTMYFEANDGIHGEELWSSDGTPAGTAMVQDIGPGDSADGVTFPMDNYLLFAADDHQIGEELWRTGTAPTVAPGSISGNVFYDTNGNGLQDSGEQTIPSWGVYLDTNADGFYEPNEPEVNCDSNGQYTFTNVLPGIYQVRPVSQDKWTDTAPLNGAQVVTVSAGQAVANIDLGEVRGRTFAAGSTSTPVFTGISYSLSLTYLGFNPVTSWAINWGDGSPVQTVSGNSISASHTFASASGSSPFSIIAWGNSVDGSSQSLPFLLPVYAAPVLNNGTLSLSGTSNADSVSFANVGGVLSVTFNGASEKYNSSLVTKVSYTDLGSNDTINLAGAIPATLNLGSGYNTVTNNDSSPVYVSDSTGKTILNATAGTTIIPANSGTGIQQLDFASINISAGAKVVFANSSATLGNYSNHANRTLAIVDAGGLNIASGGTLDIGDNSMLLKYLAANKAATDSMVSNLVTSGYAGGAWSGTGITSSEANYDAYFGSSARAVGWADQSDVGVNSFEGDSADVFDGDEVMIKFTYYGDTDLDGKVASSDSANFSTGVHLSGNAYWEFGDFNYSGGKLTASDSQAFSTGLAAYKTFGLL